MHDSLKQTKDTKGHELPLIFVAESNETARQKIKYLLEAQQMHVHLADDGRRMRELIEEDKPDLIILDVNLPGINATEFLHGLKQDEQTRSILIMLLSPSATTLRNIRGLAEGADDFMAKPFFNGLLVAKVKAMLRLKALQDELEEANRMLAVLSMTDPLTGLYNYRHLYSRLGEEMAAAKRYNTPLSCISFDIDFFKSVNDSFGHQFGDLVLIEFADLLKKVSRESDIVARNGGEEFMIVLPRTPIDKARAMANRALDLVREHQFKDDRDCIRLTTSAGITGIRGKEGVNVDELIRRVDIALYKAKKTGRNQACTWSEGDQLLPEDDPEHDNAEAGPKRVQPRPEQGAANDPKPPGLGREAHTISDETMKALGAALGAKDSLATKHAKRTSELAKKIALAQDLDEGKAEAIHQAALLHDIGRIAIRDDILKKEGPLTEAEQKMLQKHPEYSVQILKNVRALADQLPMVRHHHERYDGYGYPAGLSGDDIPIGARMLAVANAFVTMTTPSRYKKAMNRGMAIAELRKNAGSQFDPRIVETLISLVEAGETKQETSGGGVV